MTNEEKARALGNDPEQLAKRLTETKSVLFRDYRKIFSRSWLDFPNKRLVSECGRYAIQWKLRPDPEQPESSENQQTSTGCCDVVELKPEEQPVKVVFRLWQKEVIALFPGVQGNTSDYTVDSYMHRDQHGSADYQDIVRASRPATEEEYYFLKRELETAGYKLRVISKAQQKDFWYNRK